VVHVTEFAAVRWVAPDEGGPAVRVVDQRKLPGRVELIDCRDVATLAEAIRMLRVRGAPALGVAGGYGVVLGALTGHGAPQAAALLTSQRPTAVNLGWACRRVVAAGPAPEAMLAEARAIDDEDRAACRAMGRHGAALLASLRRPARLLTHCNTGALACQGIGTAFGVARTLFEEGRLERLWVDETRPLLQGARLTAFEAAALGIPHTLLADAAAGSLFAAGSVDAVAVGADRIAANGDTANKVGTYPLAVLADRHGVPFYVVAPTSTIDLATAIGAAITVEQRSPDEVRTAGGAPVAPDGTPVYNPAFDVTPAALVTAIVTERGVAWPPFEQSLASWCGRGP
jgi:methylthioribose-1-phosphate isomerase